MTERERKVLADLVEQIQSSGPVDDHGKRRKDHAAVHEAEELLRITSGSRKEVYCKACGSYQPMIEDEPEADDNSPYPWGDITCGTCHSLIATVQVVPNDKPLEPPKPAVE
jgi:hypothetical protein